MYFIGNSIKGMKMISLNKEYLIGDMMYALNLTYFAYLQFQRNLINLSSQTSSHLINSNSVFGYEPQVTYMFGIPKNVKSGGIILDSNSSTTLLL